MWPISEFSSVLFPLWHYIIIFRTSALSQSSSFSPVYKMGFCSWYIRRARCHLNITHPEKTYLSKGYLDRSARARKGRLSALPPSPGVAESDCSLSTASSCLCWEPNTRWTVPIHRKPEVRVSAALRLSHIDRGLSSSFPFTELREEIMASCRIHTAWLCTCTAHSLRLLPLKTCSCEL